MKMVFRTSVAKAMHGRGRVRNALATERWQSPFRGVVVTHSAPLTRDEHELVAPATCAPGAALAGLTALRHDNLDGFDPTCISVVLPEGAWRPRRTDLEVHWSTELGDLDVHPLRSPRRTRPARSLVDAASWCESDRFARTIVIAGIQQGLASPRQVREALSRRGTCRRRALIIESVLDAAGGIQSLPERDFGGLRRRAALPAPTRQHRVKGPDGRYYLDVWWESLGLAAEIHGAAHRDVVRWDADVHRANELVIGGRTVLVFTSYAVRHEPDAVIDQLKRMFAALDRRAP